jgi:hypothetical protein
MDLTPLDGPPAAAPRVAGFAARTLLGFGAHGEVWLADDLTTGGRVALKVGRRVDADPADPGWFGSGDRDAGAMVEQETALLCRIEHPHIVRLQRVVPLPDRSIALVLDLADGGSLASLMAARGPFEPGEVSTLLIPLASALQHLHQLGVVHGDLAPGNVLFTAEGRPQLGDLGAARILGTRTAQLWQTPGFVDPAFRGSGARSHADLELADLWGLAAVGWFALTGQPPDPDSSRQPDDEEPKTTGPLEDLRSLLLQCLSRDPQLRPDLAELADRAWQAAHPTPVRLVTELPVGSDPAGLPRLSERVTRRQVPDSVGSLIPPVAALTSARGPVGAQVAGWSPDPARRRGRAAASVILASLMAAGIGFLAVRWISPESGQEQVASGTAGPGRQPSAGQAHASGEASSPEARGKATSPGSVGKAPSAGVTAKTSLAAPGGKATSVSPGETTKQPVRLGIEIGQALGTIGRARAAAFSRVSTDPLAQADESGSPAERADVELVNRLRSEGYRLDGVGFRVSSVQIVRRTKALVQVRAVVTTSSHRQQRSGSGTGTSVPQDGPRAIVFTVISIGSASAGPARWRIRDARPAT